MAFFDKIKQLFTGKAANADEASLYRTVSLEEIRKHYDADELNVAAKDLKLLLELYGKRKSKKHKFKGREFIDFILGSKHKDQKNAGFQHWQNIVQIIESNKTKAYPYYKEKMKDAIDFFSKEIRDINGISIEVKKS
ncbi:MAG: hypothetical protein PHP32_02165 [Candidatus Izemoplasmatales bacterium]|nr:hypothetical protein [Candidatus Izemoplasmatales bacterium]